MALAIRFDGLLREETIRDYAELARLGRVTRARITQIMKLLDLAPDIQEQLLFLPPIPGLNERNLRPVVARIDWRAASWASSGRPRGRSTTCWTHAARRCRPMPCHRRFILSPTGLLTVAGRPTMPACVT